jgi:hypothetical protein
MSHMKNQLLFALIIITLSLLFCGREAQAQRLVAKVNVNVEKLTQESKTILASLGDQLTRYINDYDWVENSRRFDVPVNVDVFINQASTISYENRFDAQLVLSSQTDYQASDKRWEFAYQQGAQLTHSDQFNALTDILDFYFYIMLGQELDKSQKLDGTQLYEKASQIAQASKFSEFYEFGWKERQDNIQKILSETYKPMRELEYFTNQAKNRMRIDDRKTAGQYLRIVLIRLHSVNPEDPSTVRFYELRNVDLGRMLTALGMKAQLQELATLDPAHNSAYQDFLKQIP